MRQKYPLKRMCDVGITLLDCVHKTPKPTATGYPYIAIPEIRNGRLDLSNVRLISEEDYMEWTKKTTPQEGDIIVTRRARVGDSAVIPPNLPCAIGQNLVILRSDNTQVFQTYLRWVLRSPQYWAEVEKYLNQGSIFDSLNCREIPLFEIPVPTLDIQEKISSILSSLDKKIELNTRMNKVLEEIAQTLFKHWFVDFEFPNAEGKPYRSSGGKMVESEMGLIPEGWSSSSVNDFLIINPKLSLKKGDMATYVDMASLPTDVGSISEKTKKLFAGGSKFQNGDVLLARITPCLENGKTAFVDFLDDNEVGFGSTEFIVLRGKGDVKLPYVYSLARSEEFRKHCIANMIGSSGRQRVQNSCFNDYLVAVAPENIFQEFNNVCSKLFEQISCNTQENKILVNLRDTLLPKLMSGEIALDSQVIDTEKVVD